MNINGKHVLIIGVLYLLVYCILDKNKSEIYILSTSITLSVNKLNMLLFFKDDYCLKFTIMI